MNDLGQFPLFWLEESKRNMEGLRDIIAHLEEKTNAMQYASTSGYLGKPTEMEGQIIETVGLLKGQVSILSSVVLAALQIIAADHERRKHRGRRALVWIKGTVLNWERTVVGNWAYRILAVISTLTVLGLLYRYGRVFLARIFGQ